MYPALGRLMGVPKATATMSRDHVEVVRLTDELATLRVFPEAGPDAKRAKELFERMEHSAARVKSQMA